MVSFLPRKHRETRRSANFGVLGIAWFERAGSEDPLERFRNADPKIEFQHSCIILSYHAD
jgi:hypothetical protein